MATPNTLEIQAAEDGQYFDIAHLKIARTAFVGRTLRGPVNRPVLIKSFNDYQTLFGGLWQPSTLGYAVEQFFENGGREACIVRIVNGARCATLSIKAGAGCLVLRAVRPGTREFLRASVDYDNIGAEDCSRFNLTVQRVRSHGSEAIEDQEIFPRLSICRGTQGDIREAFADSELVALHGAAPAARPDRTIDPSSGLAIGYINSNCDGDDGAPVSDYDVIGSQLEQTGIFALDLGDDFNLLCIPPLSREQDVGLSTWLVAARFCRLRRAILIVDPPSHWHTADEVLRAMGDWHLASEDAVMFFPRVLAHDKLRGHHQSFAPCGAVAGILARADEPAALWRGKPEEAILRPGFRTSCLVPEDRRARLAKAGINTLLGNRSATRIDVQWRTLARGAASCADWQYLQARRFAFYVLNCVERGTRWVMAARTRVAPAELLAARVVDFLESLHERGAFGERSPADSFCVIPDGRVASQFIIAFTAVRSEARQPKLHAFRIELDLAGAKVSPTSLAACDSGTLSPIDAQWVEQLASRLL